MASCTSVYKHFCLSILFQTCYRNSIEHNIKGKKPKSNNFGWKTLTKKKGKNLKDWAKNHVKSCSKLHFWLYMPMWCPFNGTLITASCVLWLIWMLRNVRTFGSFDFEFWFEQRTFKVELVFHQTLLVSQLGALDFHNIQTLWCGTFL
jgi:hypothetical protein